MRMSKVMSMIDSSDESLYEVGEEELKKIHALLVDMLEDFSSVCKKYDIKWNLTAGGMLGAVRHGGFIPWDDDMDINMTRESFNKFVEVFEAEMGEKYVLAMPGDKNYPWHFPKIYKKGTKFRGIQSTNYSECGFFIDIFILENTRDNKFLRYIHGLKSTFYAAVVSAVRTNRYKADYLKITKNNKKARRSVKLLIFIGKLFWFKSLESWLKTTVKCYSKVKNSNSKYIVVPSGTQHYFGELYLRDKMCTTKEVPFEDTFFPIPEDSDYYLKIRYGDYMTVPPVEERRNHVVVELDFGDGESKAEAGNEGENEADNKEE